MLVNQNQVDRIINYIGVLTRHPNMVTGKDDDVEAALRFLGSVRFALLAVFDLPVEWRHAYEQALIKRGHKLSRHIDQDLREKGDEPTEIIKELGFIELEMWEIIKAKLDE